MNTFKKWVAARGGPTPVSEMLGVTRQTVNNWISGRSTPNAEKAHQIMRLSRARGPRVFLVDVLTCRGRNA